MKIVHAVRSLDPRGGGPPMVVAQLAAHLAQLGHEVRVIANAAPQVQELIDGMIHSIPGGDKVQYLYITDTASEKTSQLADLKKTDQLTDLLKDAEFVHLHGVWDGILKAGASRAYRLGIPYAIAPHGMLDPWSLAQKRWKKKLALILGYRAMLNRSAFLHLLNQDEKDLLAPLGLKCKMEVIANGITVEEFRELPKAGTFRAIHSELGSAPYIIFLGRLHFKKGLDLLAQAFEQIAKTDSAVHLVIAGSNDGAEPGFREQIAAANLTDRVHLVGPIFGREKLAALVDSACFCLPDRQEGFSMAILEALACARPVVITSACHFPEVATSGSGEVVQLAVPALTEGLNRILADIPRAEQMGKTGREMVLQRYTWPAIAAQLVETYQRHL